MRDDEEFSAWLLDRLQSHAPRSMTPEELARAASIETPQAWRAILPRMRRLVIALSVAGKIDILRKGKPVDPLQLKGVFRLRFKPLPKNSDSNY